MADLEIIKPEDNKIIINNMPIYIRSIDRTMKAVGDWWTAMQQAESVYYPIRAELYDILSTVEIDGHLSGVIDKRVRGIVNKKLYFKRNDKKVDALDELANNEVFKEMRKERCRYITHGLYGMEFIPGSVFAFKKIPIKHINVSSRLITTEQWGYEGFSYEGVWNIVVKGEPGYFGLLNKCAPYALWKKGVMGDWAQFIEIFGQPFIMFLYNGYDEKTKKELDEALTKMGSGTKMQLPKEIEPKVFDGKQSNGDGSLQDKFRYACNEEMSVIILGVTETTTSSKNSGYAQSSVHLQEQDEVTIDDMSDELSFINSPEMMAIFKSYGYPVAGGQWVYEDEVDLDNLKKKVDIVVEVAKIAPVSDDYLYEITNIPKPDNYDELKKKMEEQKQNPFGLPVPPAGDPKKEKQQKQPPPSQASNKFLKKLAAFFSEPR